MIEELYQKRGRIESLCQSEKIIEPYRISYNFISSEGGIKWHKENN